MGGSENEKFYFSGYKEFDFMGRDLAIGSGHFMSRILGVLFDFDGTLYHAGFLRFIVAICFPIVWIRHPIRTLKDIYILIHYRRAIEWIRNHDNHGIDSHSQVKRVVSVTGIPAENVRESVVRWMEKMPLLFINLCARRSLIRMIKTWYEQGIPMGVYSDYDAKEKLEKLGIGKYMSPILCSSDSSIGQFKPGAAGFNVAAKQMKLSPETVVYLGDREDTDVVGAQNAGMQAFIVNRANLLRLQKLIK